MARVIIKQPDGLYAEYSTIVDAFFVANATVDEIIQNAREEAADEAERMYREKITKADNGHSSLSWRQALENHNKNSPPEERINS